MTDLFAGMGALTAAIHGAPITVTPQGGAPTVVQAVFREEPTTINLPDGTETVTVLPLLRGPKDVLGGLATDDVVLPGDGRTYRIVAAMPTKNPSADSHLVFQLELINAAPAS